jgi:protein O-mannosyl-transferase
VALFFGIHPMNVEAVSWITSRSIVLYTFFFLGGLITYIYYLKDKRFKYLVFTFILFVLSLLSKAAAVCFPLVLILINFYINSSNFKFQSLKHCTYQILLLIIAIIFGIIMIITRTNPSLPITYLSSYTIFDRIFLVFYTASFYIIKLFIPTGLCSVHYYVDKLSGILPVEYYLSVLFILGIVIFILLIKSTQLKKDLIFGSLFYLITIVFVLQIIPYSTSNTPERYAYIPFIGLVFASSKICLRLCKFHKSIRVTRIMKKIFIFIMVIAALIYSIMTYERNKVWVNFLSVCNDVVEKNPRSYWSFINRGHAKASLGDRQGAIKDFNEAIEINPQNEDAFDNRGDVKYFFGDKLGAIEDYNRAIEINKTNPNTFIKRGKSKNALGDFQGAIEDYNKALEINPNFAETYYKRGLAKASQKDMLGAIMDFNKAIELNPNDAKVFSNRGNAKASLRDLQGAMIDFNKAIEIDPRNAQSYNNRGNAKYFLGDKEGGCEDWEKSGELGNPQAYDLIRRYCK